MKRVTLILISAAVLFDGPSWCVTKSALASSLSLGGSALDDNNVNEKLKDQNLNRDIRARLENMHDREPIEIQKNIEQIISKYIAPGIAASEAKKLLSENGFTINVDPNHFPPRSALESSSFVAILRVSNSVVSSISVTLYIKENTKYPHDIEAVNVKVTISTL